MRYGRFDSLRHALTRAISILIVVRSALLVCSHACGAGRARQCALVLGAFLAGADSGHAEDLPVDSITLDYVAGLASAEGEEAASRIGDVLTDEIVALCDRQEDSETCMRAELLKAFDRGGYLDRECKETGTDLLTCVIVGAEIATMLVAAGRDPNVELDLSDLSKAFNGASDLVDERAEMNCKEKGHDPQPDCLTLEWASLLGFSEAIGARCASHEKFIRERECIDNVRIASIYMAGRQRRR